MKQASPNRNSPSPNNLVLATKLHIPPGRNDTLSRPRLSARLDQGLHNKLTFIAAPAGFGKSTLLADWARQQDVQPGWVSLDKEDNDLVRFWQYIIASVDSIHPGFMDKTASMLTLLQLAQPEPAITILINELHHLNQPVTLVLDDFHNVTDDRLIASFHYFLEYLPGTVHMFIASRREPAFPAARMLSRQLMIHMGAEELRFTLQEGGEFYLQCMQLELPPSETNELVRKTEGWITAMKLAALSFRSSGQTPAVIREFAGDSRLLEQYLLEEVFLLQSEPVQAFLMASSVLKRMNAPLCRAVTGYSNSQEILEYLEQAQLFMIPLDEKKGWYRYHHLFSEFLYRRLDKESPERIPSLLKTAGEWCQSQGLQEEALDYYLTGHHYDLAVRLLEEMAKTMIRSDWGSLSTWLSAVPDSFLIERPFLYFSYALTLLFGQGQYAKVEKMLRHADDRYKEYGQEWPEDERNDFLGSYYFVQSFYASEALNDIMLVVENMKKSKTYKPKGIKLVYAQNIKSMIGKPSLPREHESMPRGHMGKDATYPFLQHLIEMVDDQGLAGSTRASLSELLYEWNDLDEAEEHARKAMERTDFHSPMASEAYLPAWLCLARIKQVRGLPEEAEHYVLEAKRNLAGLGIPFAVIHCDAELAQLALRNGDKQPAEQWLAKYRLSASDQITVQQLYEYKCAARFLMELERREEAWSLMEKLQEIAEKGKRRYYWIGIMVLQSLHLYRSGQTEQALTKLQEVMYDTEPEGLVRTYVDEGKPMAELLTLYLESWTRLKEGQFPSLDYVRRLRGLFGGSHPMVSKQDPLSLILTKQEYTVLQLIIQGLTNKEIAAKLNIGYGTVRTHINNIYSKLHVQTRPEAIRKGMELKL